MSKFNRSNQFILSAISCFLLACSPPIAEKDQEMQKRIENLETKLSATEAQLLNVKSELAKCAGDSVYLGK